MAVQIKEGVTLHPFGTQCGGFTSESEVSPEVMDFLFGRFPAEKFEEVPDNSNVKPKKKAK